jgi:hypothetical protein
VGRHAFYVSIATVCADMCIWRLSHASLTYETIERLYVISEEAVRHVAMYHYQSFAEFRKVEEEVWYAARLIIATSVLPIAWSMALSAATALVIVSLTEQLVQCSRTYSFLHGIVSLSRSSILLTNDCYTRWSSDHWSLVPFHQWLIERVQSLKLLVID